MRLANIPVYLRVIYGTVFLVGALLVYQLWTGQKDVAFLTQAPLGNSIGADDAPVTIVEFIDYRCSHCRDIHPAVKAFAQSRPDVRIVFRHLPLFGLPSLIEAQFALAAGMQGEFSAVHDFLMSRQQPLNEADIPSLAAGFGLDSDRLAADMKGEIVYNFMLDTVHAAERMGVSATPTFMIDGKVVQIDEIDHVPVLKDLVPFMDDVN